MAFSDKLKQFSDKARDAAAEHKDQISKAVESAAVVADKRTRGKYTDTIQKATQKTEAVVDRLASDEAETPPAPAPSAAPPSPGTEPEPPAQA
jgi:antitoxin protein of toxin-antitoxin system